MTDPRPTPSQTVGPFYAILFLRGGPVQSLCGPDTDGERIRIEGRVLDGDGAPVGDALIEMWQANSFGRYNHPADTSEAPLDPAFTGFGRAGTDESGRYWFDTIRPGRVPFDDERWQSPHIVVTVFARGMLSHAITRLYFADDHTLADDPILQQMPVERRPTLLARRRPDSTPLTYEFDIVLQGEDETVFFQYG